MKVKGLLLHEIRQVCEWNHGRCAQWETTSDVGVVVVVQKALQQRRETLTLPKRVLVLFASVTHVGNETNHVAHHAFGQPRVA